MVLAADGGIMRPDLPWAISPGRRWLIMTKFPFTCSCIAAALILAAAIGTPRAQLTPDAVTAFTNVTVIDVRTGRLAPDSSILVRGNRIVAVDASIRINVPEGATIVNGGGAHVIPGL